jgi:hypothetical protein
MRFVIATIMMFLFLSSSREFVELSKLPLLIEHYKKHKMENGSLSLTDFLKIHYTKETESDNDDNEDDQLPFKNIFDNHLSQLYLPVSEARLDSANLNYISQPDTRFSDWKPCDFIFAVFHPPCIS